MLRYTLMRLGIFVGCFAVVWALVYAGVLPKGLGDSNYLWVVALALLVSAPISFVALRGVRDRASEQIVARVDRAKANLDANRTMEDGATDGVAGNGADRAASAAAEAPADVEPAGREPRPVSAPQGASGHTG